MQPTIASLYTAEVWVLGDLWIVVGANSHAVLEYFANLSESSLRESENPSSKYDVASRQSTIVRLYRAEVWVLSVCGLFWMQNFLSPWGTSQIFPNIYSKNPESTLLKKSSLKTKYDLSSKQSSITCLYRAEVGVLIV